MRKFKLTLKVETDDNIEMGMLSKIFDYAIKIPDCLVTETKIEEIKGDKNVNRCSDQS